MIYDDEVYIIHVSNEDVTEIIGVYENMSAVYEAKSNISDLMTRHYQVTRVPFFRSIIRDKND